MKLSEYIFTEHPKVENKTQFYYFKTSYVMAYHKNQFGVTVRPVSQAALERIRQRSTWKEYRNRMT